MNVVTHVNMLIKVVNGSCLQLCKDFIPCKLRVGDLFYLFISAPDLSSEEKSKEKPTSVTNSVLSVPTMAERVSFKILHQ